MRKKRWLLHAGCGGPVILAELLNRQHGQCNGCGVIGWVRELDSETAEIDLATDADTKALLKLAEKELEPQSYASCMEPRRLHIGGTALDGKAIYTEGCMCRTCLKKRKKEKT